VVREIEQLVAVAAADPRLRGATVRTEFKGFVADGCEFPATQAISRLLSARHQEITGEELPHYAAKGLTDARFYPLYQGTEATCYGPDCDAIHGIDESVGLDSLHSVTRVLALTLADWCGVEPA
jgi:acetylornithine deacetylase